MEELKAKILYDLIAKEQIEPKQEYYKLIVMYKDALLFDIKLEGQVLIAELLSNKEHKLIMTQSRLSTIVKILEVL